MIFNFLHHFAVYFVECFCEVHKAYVCKIVILYDFCALCLLMKIAFTFELFFAIPVVLLLDLYTR